MKLYSRRKVLARAGRVAIVVGFSGYMDYFLVQCLLQVPQYLGLQ